MAGRLLNRRELRKQSDQVAGATAVMAAEPVKKVRAKKVAATPKVRKPRAKKAPSRMCARWGIFDGGMKQVAIFDYNQKAAADSKLADLLTKKKGTHFIQIVKEPMLEPVAVEAALPA
jgi:hypothetical protein